MPLIQTSVAGGDEQSDDRPTKPPAFASGAHPVKYSYAEQAEFREVRKLTNSDVHEAESVSTGGWKKPVQDGNEYAPCLPGAEKVSGKNRNQDGYADCGKPKLESRSHPAEEKELSSPRLHRAHDEPDRLTRTWDPD
jgi:hypothetical protein